MDSELPAFKRPKFRDGVIIIAGETDVQIVRGSRKCSFGYGVTEGMAVSRLLAGLQSGGLTPEELTVLSPEIAEKIPPLLIDFNRLRLVTESDAKAEPDLRSGAQLYREIRRLADRTTARVAKSSFYSALIAGEITPAQLIGYALEYHWIVKSAPGLIGPALALAQSSSARVLLQDFLKSELGHDRFLVCALTAVGISSDQIERHLPLPATFALCASLGVYARQHPLSFAASLFLFERAQPEFLDAFDSCCRDLDLPEAFYEPMRAHARINEACDHEDISRSLMQLETVVDGEVCTVVKRHVAIMVETLVRQEEQILDFYGQPEERDVVYDLGSSRVGSER